MVDAIVGSSATQNVGYENDTTGSDAAAFASVFGDTGSSVPDETTTEAQDTQTAYDPIPWKPTSEAGVAQGASAGDDPGFGSVDPVQSTFQAGTGSTDLAGWKLTLPVDLDGDGDADEITGDLSGYSSEYFAQDADGSITMTTSTGDLATTENSSYGRTELRGMINPDAGDKDIGNNMVLSTAPAADQEAAGAVDGTLSATMSVDQVSESGDPARVGRTVIGQIHSTENEPLKLYYRKLPDNELGSVFFSHENADGTTEDFYDLIGSRSDTAESPIDGIALGEDFNYDIDISGDSLTVSVTTNDGMEYAKTIDISESGYDASGEHMYFKAGAYDQNNTSPNPEEDHVDVTFSDISTAYGGVSAESLATAGEAVDPETQAANEAAQAEAYDEAYEAAYAEAYQSYVDQGYSEADAENLAENDAEDIAEDAAVGVTAAEPVEGTDESTDEDSDDTVDDGADDVSSEDAETEKPADDVADSAYQEAYDVAYAAAYEEAYEVAYQEAYDGLIAEGVEPGEAENQAEDLAENQAEDIAENKAEDAAEDASEDAVEDGGSDQTEEEGGSSELTGAAYQNAFDAAYDLAYQDAYEDALAQGLTPAEAENQAEDIAENEAEDAVEGQFGTGTEVSSEENDVSDEGDVSDKSDESDGADVADVQVQEDTGSVYDVAYAAAYQEAYDGFIAEGLDENEAENLAEDVAENKAEDAVEDAQEV